MKKTLVCALVLALVAGTASALSVGPGGYIYSSVGYKSGSYWAGSYLYRTTVNGNWDNTTKAVNFDTIAPATMLARQTPSPTTPSGLDKVEVWDPRAQGGQGDLALVAPVLPRSGSLGTGQYCPWDVAKIDADTPANNTSFSVAAGNVLMVGSKNGSNSIGETSMGRQAVRTPANWSGKTTNDVGIVFFSGNTKQASYRYDANKNGTADNISSEFTQSYLVMPTLPGTANQTVESDMEMGKDGALYLCTSYGSPGAGTVEAILRYTMSADCLTATRFMTAGGSGNPIGRPYNGYASGIAVGGTANQAIVYAVCQDNVNSTYTTSIFALVDGNNDGAVDYTNSADKVVKIWKSGDLSLTQSAIYDIEYYKDDNNTQWLLFSGGNADSRGMYSLYAMQLGDNGLSASGARLVGANLAGQYFELDANPGMSASVPEPASMLLLGTGALAVAGYVRRRRMS